MSRVKPTDLDKPWAARRQLKRDTTIIRQVRSIFLIFCEGRNTEPEYFKSFPVNTETQIQAIGLGKSRTSLVKHVIEIATNKELLKGQKYHDTDRQIWCVFDMDTKGDKGEDDDFDNAIKLAEMSGLRVAYSNDSFELWFLLHDKYLESRLRRSQYYEYLSGTLQVDYIKHGKNLKFCKALYALFADRQHIAIKNAERLVKSHYHEARYSRKNPCTTVHELVIQLNTCLKT